MSGKQLNQAEFDLGMKVLCIGKKLGQLGIKSKGDRLFTCTNEQLEEINNTCDVLMKGCETRVESEKEALLEKYINLKKNPLIA